MSEIEKERFCSNSDCKFHNHYVSVGSKYLEYIDPDQFGEIGLVRRPRSNRNQKQEDQKTNPIKFGFFIAKN